MFNSKIAITATTPTRITEAKTMAARLDLPFIEPIPDAHREDYVLVFSEDYLGLQIGSDKKFAPFYIDFLSGKMRYRFKQAGRRKEALARALGCKPQDHCFIVDGTAGLGRDSFILATLGYEITLIEQSPILYLLLQDALHRAATTIAPVIDRMHLIQADTKTWLKNSPLNPDIVYLDPMFPERKKSASVKKEMVILQNLLGKDENVEDLFDIAIACATRRVVIKRPRLAPFIKQEPSFSLTGKTSRFDVYLTQTR